MKTLKRISKILFFPVIIIGMLLLVLKTTNLFPNFFQSTNIDYIVHKFLFPSQQVIYPFDTIEIGWMLVCLFFIFLLLLIHIFMKDKDIRIGIKMTTGLFVVLFLIFFCWLWLSDPQNREIRPVEDEDECIMIEQCEEYFK